MRKNRSDENQTIYKRVLAASMAVDEGDQGESEGEGEEAEDDMVVDTEQNQQTSETFSERCDVYIGSAINADSNLVDVVASSEQLNSAALKLLKQDIDFRARLPFDSESFYGITHRTEYLEIDENSPLLDVAP